MARRTTQIKPEQAPEQTGYFGIEPEKIDLIRKTVAEGATEDELKVFLYHCSRTGLDPLARQIYFQKRFNRRKKRFEMTIITGIDGYRLIADRTGKYAGNDDPVFDDESKVRKASVTVYKMIGSMRCPFTASARWDQYYPGDEQGFMWRKMPHLMLGKCAEALALRKAFPAELSGIYIKEEMDQADLMPDEGHEEAGSEAKQDYASEAYSGSAQQREYLRQAFQTYHLENRDKHIIASRLQGRPLRDVHALIEEYMQEQSGQEDKAEVKEQTSA